MDGYYRRSFPEVAEGFSGNPVELAGGQFAEYGHGVPNQLAGSFEVLDTEYDGGIGRDGLYQFMMLDELSGIRRGGLLAGVRIQHGHGDGDSANQDQRQDGHQYQGLLVHPCLF